MQTRRGTIIPGPNTAVNTSTDNSIPIQSTTTGNSTSRKRANTEKGGKKTTGRSKKSKTLNNEDNELVNDLTDNTQTNNTQKDTSNEEIPNTNNNNINNSADVNMEDINNNNVNINDYNNNNRRTNNSNNNNTNSNSIPPGVSQYRGIQSIPSEAARFSDSRYINTQYTGANTSLDQNSHNNNELRRSGGLAYQGGPIIFDKGQLVRNNNNNNFVNTRHSIDNNSPWTAQQIDSFEKRAYKMETFRGEATEDVVIWLRLWEEIVGLDAPQEILRRCFVGRLQDDAKTWYMDLPIINPETNTKWTFEELRLGLRGRFMNSTTMANHRMLLNSLIKEKGGQNNRTVSEYYSEFRSYFNLSDLHDDVLAVELFIEGLKPALKQLVYVQAAVHGVRTLKDALALAEKMEPVARKNPGSSAINSIDTGGTISTTSRAHESNYKGGYNEVFTRENSDEGCWYCGKKGHRRARCWNYLKSVGVLESDIRILQENRRHNSDLRDRPHNLNRPPKPTGANAEPPTPRFKYDGSIKKGEVASIDVISDIIPIAIFNNFEDLPELLEDDEDLNDTEEGDFHDRLNTEYFMYADDCVEFIRPTVFMVGGGITYPAELRAVVNGQTTIALLDTGATISLVSENILLKGGGATLLPYEEGPVTTANNQYINVIGLAQIEVKLGQATIDCIIPVVRDISRNLIIGKDMMKILGAKMDMINETVTFTGCKPISFARTTAEINSLEPESSIFSAYASKNTIIPPRTETTIELDINPRIRELGNLAVISGNSKEIIPDYQVGNALINIGVDTVYGIVANLGTKPISIVAGELIGEVTPFWDLESKSNTVNTHINTANFQPHDILLGDSLTEQQKSQAYELIAEYADVFAETLTEPGKLKVAPATIDLTHGATLSNTRNYRRSAKEHDQIKEIMEDKLKKKVAEPSTSSYASPLILVPKKTGGLRMCVDLRKLNKVTITQTFPMPRPDDLFATVRGSILFSLADATWGYWQINLAEGDREKAAYMTREGLFQPTTMDFGMKNAPIIWQRAMHLVFQGLLWDICVIYIDDLLIFSKTFEEHLRNMKLCLDRCRVYNLKLRPSKCEFFRTKINFLGHVISGEGVEVNAAKVSKIVDIPAPDTAAKLNSFVCLVAYYREFIRDFATEAHVLRELVRSKTFEWKEEHQKAFEKLKQLLLNSVILRHPDPSRPFLLECDASDFGIGYILAQLDTDGKTRVIAFGSRALTPRGQNFSATERECLAIVEGVKKFHVYLHGNEFTIKTDHKALIWLMNHNDHTSKLMRWALKLQEYRFTILHREGKNNANADAMSRLVEAQPRVTTIQNIPPNIEIVDMELDKTPPAPEILTIDTAVDNIDELTKAQWNDKKFRRYIKYLRYDKLPKNRTKALEVMGQCQTLELWEGVLYHIWSPRDVRHREDTRRQVAIPNDWISKILNESHNSNLTGGHLGFTKTHHKIRERYWWPGMYSGVKEYVKSCTFCQKRKGSQPRNAGTLQAIVANDPWEHVGMDIFGPLPTTIRGNRYILTFTDMVTKYVEGAVLTEATEKATATVLVDLIISRHGVMEKLTSDRGSNFVANAISELYKILEIRKINTTAWHPQGNGQTERFNQPLADMLAIYTDGKQKDWDIYFPGTLFAYNISIHETTKYSPFYLVYGREPRFPLELALGTANKEPVGGTVALAEEMAHKLRTAFTNARINIREAQHKMEIRAAQIQQKHNFIIGDKVWLFVKRRTDDKLVAKLKFPWQGPFEITKIISPNVVALRKRRGIRLGQNVHVNRLKHFFERRPDGNEPELDIEDDFDLEEEDKAIEKSTLGEGEEIPPEEIEIKKILAHQLHGDHITFQIAWIDGTTTWETEDNISNCAALDDYYGAKPNNPFFGLLLQLQKFDYRFKKRFTLELAKELVIKAISEFCLDSPHRKELIREIHTKGFMTELRNCLANLILKFRDKMAKLKPTYIPKFTDSGKKRVFAEVNMIQFWAEGRRFVCEIEASQPRPEEEILDQIGPYTLGTAYQIHLEDLTTDNLTENRGLVMFREAAKCALCNTLFPEDQFVALQDLKGHTWCYKCCEREMWRRRYLTIQLLIKLPLYKYLAPISMDILRIAGRLGTFLYQSEIDQVQTDEFGELNLQHFLITPLELIEKTANLIEDKVIPAPVGRGEILQMPIWDRINLRAFITQCYSCRKIIGDGYSLTFNDPTNNTARPFCAACRNMAYEASNIMEIGMFCGRTKRCINNWAHRRTNPSDDELIPSFGTLIEHRRQIGIVFEEECRKLEAQIHRMAREEMGIIKNFHILRNEEALKDIRTDWPRPYAEAFEYKDPNNGARRYYDEKIKRICAACATQFTSWEKGYWDEDMKHDEIAGENLCGTCAYNGLWAERAFDAETTCVSPHKLKCCVALFWKANRLFLLLSVIATQCTRLMRALYFHAMGPTEIIGNKDTYRITDYVYTPDNCIVCGETVPDSRPFSLRTDMSNKFGMCRNCFFDGIYDMATKLQIQIYNGIGKPAIRDVDWDGWRIGLMWTCNKRIFDEE